MFSITKIPNLVKTEIKKLIQEKINQEKETAYIISTYPLDIQEIKEIKDKIKLLENKKIINLVKKDIIAGLIIKLDSYEIDFSLASKIKNIKKLLKNYRL